MSLSVILRTPVSQLLRGRLGPIPAKRTARSVAEESGLPEEVRAVVLGVVKRSRLKRHERLAVAEELVGHFADALAQGATPGDAVREFGDVKTAAKLIRRGMVRKRPIWWHALRAIRWTVAGLLAVYAGITVWALSGRTNVAVDYAGRMEEMVRVPASEAGWPYYERAVTDVEAAGKERDELETAFPEVGVPTEKLAEVVTKHAETLRLIREGAKYPALGAEYKVKAETSRAGHQESLIANSTISLLLPHLNPFRSMAKLVSANGIVAAERGDFAQAIEDIETLVSMARQLKREPILVSQLVGIGLREMALTEAARLLQRHAKEIPEAHLARLAHVLSGPKVPGDLIDTSGERLFFYDMVQRVYTDDGNGSGHLAPLAMAKFMEEFQPKPSAAGKDATQRLLPYLTGGVAPLMLPSRKDLVTQFDRFMDRHEADLRRPAWQVDWADREAQFRDLKADRRYVLLTVLMPSYTRVIETGSRAIARQEAVTTAIAIELYRRRHGRYPASLSDLVPDLLPSVPLDHITGDPLLYRLDQGAWGGPMLYSVGVDRKDDLGQLPKLRGEIEQWAASQRAMAKPSDGDWVLYPTLTGPTRDRVEIRLEAASKTSRPAP